jgi:hypothetical protein
MRPHATTGIVSAFESTGGQGVLSLRLKPDLFYGGQFQTSRSEATQGAVLAILGPIEGGGLIAKRSTTSQIDDNQYNEGRS